MISYETLDAINDMNPTDTQSVSVIQTGPGVGLLSIEPSNSSSSVLIRNSFFICTFLL